LRDDGVAHQFQLLLLVLEVVLLCILVGFQPEKNLQRVIVDRLSVLSRDLVLDVLSIQTLLRDERVLLKVVSSRHSKFFSHNGDLEVVFLVGGGHIDDAFSVDVQS
ncbi:hypothetical protein PENTCL1PPCAC_20730, partial [Pristionchus entomophagus]